MDLFSERQGLKSKRNIMQIKSVDLPLKNGLWNVLTICCWNKAKDYRVLSNPENKEINHLCQMLWIHYFNIPLDTMESIWQPVYKKLRDYFFDCKWYEVYDFIEFIAANLLYEKDKSLFINSCNHFLELEYSGYRFISGKITQISSEEEIVEVENAIQSSTPLKPVHEHLKTSLELFADRRQPDYRNSVKEAISAVEALCRQITRDEKATLGQALKQIEKQGKVNLHSALKEAFSNLYGYTSDAEGIRHALLNESSLEFEDAKFMLVSCCAFTNYLISKSSKAGINL